MATEAHVLAATEVPEQEASKSVGEDAVAGKRTAATQQAEPPRPDSASASAHSPPDLAHTQARPSPTTSPTGPVRRGGAELAAGHRVSRPRGTGSVGDSVGEGRSWTGEGSGTGVARGAGASPQASPRASLGASPPASLRASLRASPPPGTPSPPALVQKSAMVTEEVLATRDAPASKTALPCQPSPPSPASSEALQAQAHSAAAKEPQATKPRPVAKPSETAGAAKPSLPPPAAKPADASKEAQQAQKQAAAEEGGAKTPAHHEKTHHVCSTAQAAASAKACGAPGRALQPAAKAKAKEPATEPATEAAAEPARAPKSGMPGAAASAPKPRSQPTAAGKSAAPAPAGGRAEKAFDDKQFHHDKQFRVGDAVQAIRCSVARNSVAAGMPSLCLS